MQLYLSAARKLESFNLVYINQPERATVGTNRAFERATKQVRRQIAIQVALMREHRAWACAIYSSLQRNLRVQPGRSSLR
jgi:hypothetical protein